MNPLGQLPGEQIEALAEALAARLGPLLALGAKEHLTPREAAALTGCTPKALEHLRAQGKLLEGRHWRRVGSRRLRYSRRALLAWLERGA